MSKWIFLAAFAVTALAAHPAGATTYAVSSPDHRLTVAVEADGTALSYTVTRDGQQIISRSSLGFFTSLGPWDGRGLTAQAFEQSSVDDTYRPPVGKAAIVRDHYSQGIVHFEKGSKSLAVDLVVRAYDDGVAIRYAIPQQPGVTDFNLYWESTGFSFPKDYSCWGANMGRPDNSHEAEFDPVKASAIRSMNLFDAPFVCKTGVGETTFALAEADKRDFAGAYYAGRGDGTLGLQVSLSSRHDNDRENPFFNTAVKASLAKGAFLTPWRVVMVGDTPGALVQSNLIATLAAPSTISDTSWIKPGKAAWDWWNGWAVDVPNPGVNTETYKAYVDFASSMHLDYILIDEGWYKGSSEMPITADVTVPVRTLDLPGVISYAQSKGIGVWVWLQWKQLDRQLDDALSIYEGWGIKGIKIDFMDRNDQDMVAFYHEVLSKAAKHHLMVDLHGAYPPDGLLRTYPNYMTQEGVLGAEYNKFGPRITATHNVTLPFTRMILGPMDYTPGGFRALSRADFATTHRSLKPFVQTTRGQALAMYVVYDSPFAMVADSPDAYKKSDGGWADGVDFLQTVPTSWDETRVLKGDIGQYIVTARRKGEVWYLGAMTNEKPRRIEIPLDFLAKSKSFAARVWQDGKDMNSVGITTRAVTSQDRLTFVLSDSGGAVAKLEPVKTR